MTNNNTDNMIIINIVIDKCFEKIAYFVQQHQTTLI